MHDNYNIDRDADNGVDDDDGHDDSDDNDILHGYNAWFYHPFVANVANFIGDYNVDTDNTVDDAIRDDTHGGSDSETYIVQDDESVGNWNLSYVEDIRRQHTS